MRDNLSAFSPTPRYIFLADEVAVPESKDNSKRPVSRRRALRKRLPFALSLFILDKQKNLFRFMEPVNFHDLQYLNGFGQLYLLDPSFLFRKEDL